MVIPYNPMPVLLTIGSLKIYSYGVMFALAFLISFLLARKKAKGGFMQEHIEWIILLAVFGGIIGARAGYIILNPKQFATLLDSFKVWDGGLTSYGGLLGAFLFLAAYIKIRKLSLLETMDFIAPYIALGFAIGRIGCLLNWDDYGRPTTVAWAFLVDNVPRHPTQIYLAAANLLLFSLLYVIYERGRKNLKPSSPQLGFLHKRGFVFLLFLLLYSLINLAVDFLRYYPPQQYFFGFALTQWIAMPISLLAAISLILRSK